MDLAAVIVLAIFVLLTAVFVIGLSVWAAVKDGQKDRALQARLGLRRRRGWAVRPPLVRSSRERVRPCAGSEPSGAEAVPTAQVAGGQ